MLDDKHTADAIAQSARMGWMPFYPQFDTNPLTVAAQAEQAVAEGSAADAASYVAQALHDGSLRPAIEDVDAPANWPRTLVLWRSNLMGSSAKGNEYFLKHLLGTHSNVLGTENPEAPRPSDVAWHDDAPEGKLDLLVSADFRMTSTTLLSDVVLPAATWYEKHDLSSTDMHPFVHAFSPAIDPPWEARTDFETFHQLARTFSTLARTHLGVQQDLVSVPLQHDTPGETAQPRGRVDDWRDSGAPGVPGRTMPAFTVVERDYTAIADKLAAVGPLADSMGFTVKNVTYRLEKETARLARKNGVMLGGAGDGRPAIDTDEKLAEAILTFSGTTNGELAVQGFRTLEQRVGKPLADLAEGSEEKRISFADTQVAPVPVITSPEWSGSETGGRRYAPFTVNVERLKPFHTLTGRMHFYLDHDWMIELGEQLPIYRPPLDMHLLFGEPRLGPDGAKQVTVRYLTPHSKWSIHSEYQDNLLMLSLSRGGPTVWMSDVDAASIDVCDNDWVECVNANGVLVARAIVTHRMPAGVVYVYHAQERTIDVPKSEATGRRGGIHNSVTRLLVKPTHLIGGYAQLSYTFNYLGPTGQPARHGDHHPQALAGGDLLMRVMAQMGMVMNLDKCIGCHTCSVTCKQAWTNRAGTEYVWFNNVETRPGQGYPRRYEDQETWQGGWELDRRGNLRLKAGGRLKKLLSIFASPVQPELVDYYEPWTYDYRTLVEAPLGDDFPVARPKSLITGEDTKITWSANWDDDLGGASELGHLDPIVEKVRRESEDKIRFSLEQTFMFYLPRICEHCLNPSCMASCPSGAIYKRAEDGIVLVDQDRCRGWRQCITGCPYKKIYFNHKSGKAEKCTFCYPRIEVGIPTVCSETCVGRLRYLGLFLYDADRVTAAAATPDPGDLYEAQLDLMLDPNDPEVVAAARADGIPEDWLAAARRSPVHALAKTWRVALPLHPEYRTMPMVWYVPPLSPVVDLLAEQGHDAEDRDTLFGAIDTLRIPVEYLAELFTAGTYRHRQRRAPQAGSDARLHARRHARPRG